MERKLELKDIAVYFPYKLKIICSITKAHTLFGYYKTFNQQWEEWAVVNNPDEKSQTSDILFDDITPILRPLSDLYRPIIHNGKEIVPIVELAKISLPLFTWELDNAEDSYYFKLNSARNEDNSYIYFDGNDFKYESIDNEEYNVRNQYQLFDYLHELKIDYRGLIDVGLAIDANTLVDNPYK